jgi:hypothetical protein
VTYFLFWAATAAPGLPLGLRLFGRQPLGWIAGLAIGYTTSCLAFWAVLAAGAASRPALAGAWAAGCVALWAAARFWPWPAAGVWRRGFSPAVGDIWSRRDLTIFAVVVLVAPLLMAGPYRNLGIADASGTRYYRAYFTADFVWHVALTSELGRFEMPPRNPYMAAEPLHYYWTYFLVPAVVTSTGPDAGADVESALDRPERAAWPPRPPSSSSCSPPAPKA